MRAKWRHSAPFGAIKFAKWRHVANKWRHLAPISGECALSPNGAIFIAKWRQIWRHVAPRGATWRHLAIANLRLSPNLGDTWRYRHVAMRHSLKKTMRKIFIAKWRHLAIKIGNFQCFLKQNTRHAAPRGAIWRLLAPFGDDWRQMAPFGEVVIWPLMAPFGEVWR